MFCVAKHDYQSQAGQGGDGGATAAELRVCSANLFRDKSQKCWHSQAQEERRQHGWIDDVDDVPGIPLRIKRGERTNTVVVSEILEQMHEATENGVEIKQLPVGRSSGIAAANFHHRIQGSDQTDYERSQYRRSD